METSAKSRHNVQQAFQKMPKDFLKQVEEAKQKQKDERNRLEEEKVK